MKGLLLKDILTLYKQTKIILLLMVVFACIPGLPTSAFAVFYGAMMPITALAYDERSKWDELAAMMPYTAKAIVGSKYALGLLLIGSISLLSAASQVVVSVVQHVPLNTETLISIPLVACGALLMMLIDLPLMFRFGVEKGRIIYILLTCGCVTYFAMNTDDVIASLDTVSVYSALLMVLAITIVAFVISYTISVRVYRARRG